MTDFKNLIIDSPQPQTLATRRLFNYLLRNALKSISAELTFKIKFKVLAGVFSLKDPTPDQLEKATTLLMRTLVKVQSDRKKITFPMLGEVAIDIKESLLLYTFPEHSREIYQNPILLEQCLIQAHFTRKYSRLLYDLLAEQHFLFNRKSYEIDIQALRDYLGVTPKKMINFSDFYRFVLEPSIEELSDYSSFGVKIEARKSGCKVTHINFYFELKRDLSNIKNAITVIPPARPKLNFNATQQALYTEILNAPIKKRRSYFNQAQKNAAQHKVALDIRLLDLPDMWLKWLSIQTSP